MKKSLILAVYIFCATAFIACSGGENVASYKSVIPLPFSITDGEGSSFKLSNGVEVSYPSGNEKMANNANFLVSYVKDLTGLELKAVEGEPSSKKCIKLGLDLKNGNKDTYIMTVNGSGVEIQGASESGVFYGVQTLRKSLPIVKVNSVVLPSVKIEDSPRFAYRGMHLDVSRHFFTVDSIKRFIDILALHNINKMHWHLTDDQGWRIEIKSHPELTEKGSKRTETVIGHNSGKYDGKPYGGFYTQAEVKDILAYAAQRYITIIPEIDLPGHMMGALHCYPELGCIGGSYEVWRMWGVSEEVLCAGNDKTYDFIKDILNEIIDIFPSEYIHVGGDECPKVRWKTCPKCQAKAKALGIKVKDGHSVEEQLQSHIISFAESVVNSRGRKIIGWDEILEGGLAPNATVMSWRGINGGVEAANQGHDVIMTPTTHFYFDYYQSTDTDKEPMAIGGYLPLEKVYSFNPIPKHIEGSKATHIIGVQANLWTEYIPTFRQVEYMLLPRMDALCEIQWGSGNKDYEKFLERLPHMTSIYDVYGYNYAKHIYNARVSYTTDDEKHQVVAKLSALGNAEIHYTLDGSEPSLESPKVGADSLVFIDKDCVFKAAAFRNGVITRVITENIKFTKSTARKITLAVNPSGQYAFMGAASLVDGLKGGKNYKTGRWIGFVGCDVDAVIDMGDGAKYSSVEISTNVVTGDWIFDARSMTVSVSDDGQNFRQIATEQYEEPKAHTQYIGQHKLTFEECSSRYLKVVVESEKSMPEWHGNKGGNAFLFIDEIAVL